MFAEVRSVISSAWKHARYSAWRTEPQWRGLAAAAYHGEIKKDSKIKHISLSPSASNVTVMWLFWSFKLRTFLKSTLLMSASNREADWRHAAGPNKQHPGARALHLRLITVRQINTKHCDTRHGFFFFFFWYTHRCGFQDNKYLKRIIHRIGLYLEANKLR